jgi:hypothetical protein
MGRGKLRIINPNLVGNLRSEWKEQSASDEAVAGGDRRGGGARWDTQLGANRGHLLGGSAPADAQSGRDLLVRLAFSQPQQHLALSGGEA